MLDFVGEPIVIGSWLACQGGGNRTAEYGQILYRVVGIKNDKMRVQRLTRTYPGGGAPPTAAIGLATLSNPNKCVVVRPHPAAVALFERVVAGQHTPQDARFVATWLHGQTSMPWAAPTAGNP